MSVQFGRWNFEGQQPAPEYIEKVSGFLALYGPDSNEAYSKGGVKIIYRAFPHDERITLRNATTYLPVRCSDHMGWPPGQPRGTDRRTA